MADPIDDLPPSYSQAEEQQPPSFDRAISHRLPRPEIPKAAPSTTISLPFSVNESSADIRGYFVANTASADSKGGPDVSLANIHGSIICQIFLQCSVPRPLAVKAECKYGLVRLAVADRIPGQAISIEVRVTAGDGDIHLAVPNDFDGTLLVHNLKGQINFRLFMTLDATQVDVPSSNTSRLVKYRIRPRAVYRAFEGMKVPPVYGPPTDDGRDTCVLSANNGKITMGYITEFVGPDLTHNVGCCIT